jgi:hypothetical protein
MRGAMKRGPAMTWGGTALLLQWDRGDPMEPVTLFETREILVPFDIDDHRLIPGCAGELGEPLEAFLVLYAVAATGTTQIATPADLSRITRAVRTEAQALAFVRLFTSPPTHFLFDKQQAVLDLVVASTSPHKVGEVSLDVARRLGLPDVQTAAAAGAFTIERCLVRARAPADARCVVLRSERVFPDGRYELSSERVLGSLSPEEVAMPLYE